MADLTITPTDVTAGGGSSVDTGIAGETITAGQVVYKDETANRRLKLADADTVAASIAAGIALNPASTGQVLNYLKSGTINLGSVVTAGMVYGVSSTAGGIAPITELGGKYLTALGIGTSSSTILVRAIPSRVLGTTMQAPLIEVTGGPATALSGTTTLTTLASFPIPTTHLVAGACLDIDIGFRCVCASNNANQWLYFRGLWGGKDNFTLAMNRLQGASGTWTTMGMIFSRNHIISVGSGADSSARSISQLFLSTAYMDQIVTTQVQIGPVANENTGEASFMVGSQAHQVTNDGVLNVASDVGLFTTYDFTGSVTFALSAKWAVAEATDTMTMHVIRARYGTPAGSITVT